jgi:hypothetical protein
MNDVLKKSLKDLDDVEVLDLLEKVSAEVQRRNRLMGAGQVRDAVSGALDTFIDRLDIKPKLPESK